jgi:hypothetical protein
MHKGYTGEGNILFPVEGSRKAVRLTRSPEFMCMPVSSSTCRNVYNYTSNKNTVNQSTIHNKQQHTNLIHNAMISTVVERSFHAPYMISIYYVSTEIALEFDTVAMEPTPSNYER